MANRINRGVELLEQDQAIYYDGPHSGHVLTYEQGRDRCRHLGRLHECRHGTWRVRHDRPRRIHARAGRWRADTSGHRTPAMIVEAPVNGTDEANVRFNAWQFRQILGRGVHGILLCQAETADAVRAFVEACRYPHHPRASIPRSPRRWSGCMARSGTGRRDRSGRPQAARHRHPRPRIGNDRGAGLGPVDRRNTGSLRPLAAESARRTAAGGEAGKPRGHRQLRSDPARCRAWASPRSDRATSASRSASQMPRDPYPPEMQAARDRVSRPAGATASLSWKAARRQYRPPGSTRACGSSPGTARRPRSRAGRTRSASCRCNTRKRVRRKRRSDNGQ